MSDGSQPEALRSPRSSSMSRWRAARFLGAAACSLALALFFLDAARAISIHETMVASGDVRFAVGLARQDETIPEGFGHLPLRWARMVSVASSDDLAFRAALELFRQSQSPPQRGAAGMPSRAVARAALSNLSAQRLEATQRSIAANLLGILALQDAASLPQYAANEAQLLVREAVERFTEAVQLNPANDDAKYNLELLLRLLQAGNAPGQSGPPPDQSGDGSGDEDDGGDFGAPGDPGSGY